MYKVVLLLTGIAALTLTTAAASVSSSCGYDANGNFRLGNGQVAAHATWEHAKACAKKGTLPSVVAERLGRWGAPDVRAEADNLRAMNAKVQEEKRKREVEVRTLPPVK